MTGSNTGLAMAACIECHNTKKVTTDCEACHREIVKPEDHKTPEWMSRHGNLARENINGCDRCHSVTSVFEVTNISDPVINYVQTNSLCWGCHQKRPASHSGNWADEHSVKAKADPDSCRACHSRTRPLKGFKGADTFCMGCHRGKHLNFNRALHPVPLTGGGKPGEMCGKCHSLAVCGKCHFNLRNSKN